MRNSSPTVFPVPVFRKNNKYAALVIWALAIFLFLVISSVLRFKSDWEPGFDPHLFGIVNIVVNSLVVILLIFGLYHAKSRNYVLHKKLMMWAIYLSLVFLVSYSAHHVLAGETKFGDLNHDGILSVDEKTDAGVTRYFYYFLLITHIPLAALFLPMILFTSYRALSGNYPAHKKLARITWPIWLYVAITGVFINILIRTYY